MESDLSFEEVPSTGATGQSGHWLLSCFKGPEPHPQPLHLHPLKWPHPLTDPDCFIKIKVHNGKKTKANPILEIGSLLVRIRCVPHPWAGYHPRPQASRSDSTQAFSLCTWQVSASSYKNVPTNTKAI